MSGQNRLVMSKNAIEGNSEEKLRNELWNANEEAIQDTQEGIPLKAANKNS